MPAEQSEPEHLDPLTVLGRVDPPVSEALERARRRLRAAVAAEAPAGDAPRQPRGHPPEAAPNAGTGPSAGT